VNNVYIIINVYLIVKGEHMKIHGFLKVNFPFVSFIDGTRLDERRSVHHRGLFTPPLELPSPLLA
jgi:hypothetical protein